LIRVAWCPLVVSSRFASWTPCASDLGFVWFGALTSVPLGVLRGRTSPSVEVTPFGCGCAALGLSVSIRGCCLVSPERNLRAHHESRLAVVEAVNHEVRKRVLREVRRDARNFASAHGFFADLLDRVVVHARVEADEVVSALALPGDVDQC